jgi:hypothetical protein
MRKSFLLFIVSIVFLSCITDDDTSSYDSYKWKFKLDGVLYEWSGDYFYDFASGYSKYSSSEKSLTFVRNPGSLNNYVWVDITLPENGTGNYTLNNSDSFFVEIFSNFSSIEYSVLSGGTMNVSITSFSNSSNGGKVKGTFSGTIRKEGEGLSNITEGSFEAIRVD